MIDTVTLFIALAALGSQWGYQRAEDGTIEYLIQLRPQEAQHLASSPGVEITSYVPDEAQPVGRIRILVGDAALPKGASPEQRKAADDSALALNDSRGRPIAAEGDTPITETQARVARPASNGESPTAGNRYGEASELDKDLAGPLVAIPAEPEGEKIVQSQGAEPSSPQEGGADDVNTTDVPTSDAAEAPPSESEKVAGSDATPSQLPDHITNPVYTTERPDPMKADVELPEFDSPEPDEATARREASPSDSPRDADDSPEKGSESSVPEDDRPWLPLAGAVAAACGFLAGNVFQWRSYLSLRKRYLNLLRTTGG